MKTMIFTIMNRLSLPETYLTEIIVGVGVLFEGGLKQWAGYLILHVLRPITL